MQKKFYRNWVVDTRLTSFEVISGETDLFVKAKSNLKRKTLKFVEKYRRILKDYIKKNPLFLESLEPLEVDLNAPLIVRKMIDASKEAGVGPMASVAGAIAEFVGNELLNFSKEIIIENGGDVFLKVFEKSIVAIYAGDSPLSGKFGIEVSPERTPCGICTSSGKVGHSLSFGNADAVTVVANSAILADALATSLANKVKSPDDIKQTIDSVSSIEGVIGVVAIADEKIGFFGNIKIVKI